MPKTTTFKGTMENAYGNKLETPINYNGSYEHLLSPKEAAKEGTVPDAIPEKEKPDEEDIYAVVNNKRKQNERQKSMQAALDAADVKKPSLDQPEVQFKQMVKILTTAGRSEEQARQMANANLGTSY